ncbi:MAG TPA: DUF5916 domain-containing protein [Thermoanaerobaculia bacterium]|jgi:hypothetical protein|nr:DUF5916 domain-containing protein [Thermoanaerobaculia bacterium]
MKRSIAVVSLLCLSAVGVAAQEPPAAAGEPSGTTAAAAMPRPSQDYSLEIHRLSSAPVIDGKLDDAVWQEGNLLDGFIQFDPNRGQPASERTEARVGYDSQNIYFGIRCYDREPAKILGSGMRPDLDLGQDDSITIVLDTFHDRRNGFLFQVNPLGARTDALVRNEGEEVNADWDGLWEAAAVRDAQGWTVEIAIPFKTLRFNHDDPQSWGFNISRYITRRQETSFWKPMARQSGSAPGYRVSEFGEIRGMTAITEGGRYQLKPYSLLRDEPPGRAYQEGTGDLGGDLKMQLTSGLVADLTVNTDFAEVEADQQQINLERFKLFYPEQRQFFLEGSNLFYFGDRPEPLDVPEKFRFFFSRQIGLAENGQVVIPVLGGAKLAGRVGGTSIGFLNLSTDGASYFDGRGVPVEEPETNFTVLRLKQQIFGGSTIGLIGLNKDPRGSDYNRGLGVDWDLAFGKAWRSSGYVARTDTPSLDGRDSAYSADLVWRSPTLRLRHRYTNIGENFNPEMGFLTRSGIVKNHFNALWTLVLENAPFHIYKVIPLADVNHIMDQHGNLETQLTTYEVTLAGRSRAGVAFLYYDDLENLATPLPIAKNVTIPAGQYRFRSLFTGISSGYSKRVGFTLWYHQGGYYGGDRLRTFLSLLIRPHDGLIIAPSFDRVKVDAPWGHFISQIGQTSVDYSLTPNLSTRVTLQWRERDNFRANFLIDWTYRPGSDLFLVYNDVDDLDTVRRESGFSPLRPGRTITIKATRRFDF